VLSLVAIADPRAFGRHWGIFFSLSWQLQTKGEKRKISFFLTKNLKETKRKSRGIDGNTYTHL
jgi:hypothetical protein